MTSISQKDKADNLLALHSNGRLLVLPNIWNPVGARILQAKGYPAAATASAAVSASLGYVDGERIKRSTLLEIISRIANSVDIPVTADIERGYADTIPGLEESINLVIDTGAAGINLEDSIDDDGTLRPVDEQCKHIEAVRNVSSKRGIHLVINARIDAFMCGTFKSNDEKIKETILRAQAFFNAGADCVFPAGPGDKDTLIALRNNITGPINILASKNAVPLTIMKEIGINRVSFGPFIFRSCLKKFEYIADELYKMGSYECFSSDILSRDEANKYLINNTE